jgi:hypothetical protein
MVTTSKGLRPKKDYAGEGQQHIQKRDTVLSLERAPHRNREVIVKD